MAIPVISDIANFISGAIQWLTQSAPKPFRVIFFMLLLVLAAIILTFTIRMMGYHCNSGAIPYHVSPLNIFGNWDLITSVPDIEQLQQNAFDASQLPPSVTQENLGRCSEKVNYGNYTFKESGGTVNFNTPTWFFSGEYCTECTLADVTHGTALLGGDLVDTWCIGDVHRVNLANKSWFKRNIMCGSGGYCQPPIGYYYRASDNKYVCEDLTICGGTSVTVAAYWDRKIIENGGTPLYPTGFTQDADSEKIFSIQCTDDLKANFTIWQIPVFDYKIWTVLLVVIGLFTFYKWHHG